MMIKRKTTEKFASFKARLMIRAADSALCGDHGDINPAAASHRFGIGEGELHANVDDNARFGDQIIPEMTITVPGFGELIVTPGEVHQLLVMIEEAQAKARNPGTYVGRESAVKVSV